MMEQIQFGNDAEDSGLSGSSADASLTSGSRISDWLNLVVMMVGVGVLIAIAGGHETGTVARWLALTFCGLAGVAGWQVVRRNRFPGRMPKRWNSGERRVTWLRVAHAIVAIAGAVGYLGFVFVWITRPHLVSRSAFPVIVFGYLIVQASFTGFFRDHQPLADSTETRGRGSFFSNMKSVQSESWGNRA